MSASTECACAPCGGGDSCVVVMRSDTLSAVLDSHSLLWVMMDRHARSVNVVDEALLRDLLKVLELVESHPSVKAVLLWSAKSSFVVGADIHSMYPLTDKNQAKEISMAGQAVFTKLESLKVPTIACINGIALGGGLEIALACSHRVVAKNKKIPLGLPEIKLGLLPGAGGTVRLPKLIGLQNALQIILAGGSMNPEKAKRQGLVDKVLEYEDRFPGENRFAKACRAFAILQTERPIRRRQPKKDLKTWLLEDTLPGRYVVERMSVQMLDKNTRGKYPAPYKALESVMRGYPASRSKALEIEATLFGELFASQESKNLISIYFLTEEAKKRAARTNNAPFKRVKKVGVIGAGVMGSAIVQLLALKGKHVYMKDIKEEFVAKGMQNIEALFDGLVKRKRMTAEEKAMNMVRITSGTSYDGFRDCDVVIEAAVEIMNLKKKILQECEQYMPEDCLFATNTSSLSVTELGSVAKHPENVLGMHFFNPVSKMPLVEIIRSSQSSDSAVATVYQLTLDIGKTPVVCFDGPGFIVNRILGLYMSEAGHIASEGADLQAVDRALVDFGMPMGPFRLMDEVGLDVAEHVSPILVQGLGDRFRSDNFGLTGKMVKAGMLGKKSGKGFYVYENGRSKGFNEELPSLLGTEGRRFNSLKKKATEVVDRCVLQMINEATRILEEGIVERPEELDLAMVMGTGFAPFRGGLLSYADSLGTQAVVESLLQLERQFGSRFSPCEKLLRMAERGEKFFPKRVVVGPVGVTKIRAKL